MSGEEATQTTQLTQTTQSKQNRQGGFSQKDSRYHPYSKCDIVTIDKSVITVNGTKYKDTGGGFLLEEEEAKNTEVPLSLPEEKAPILKEDCPTCKICKKTISKSWLLDTFDYEVCDECKDPEDAHRLITKTEALKEYLLRDYDLDKRDPPLKCIKRKNPHNSRWGEMKLYLQIQVEERALEVWGTKEKLEEELEKREEKRVLAKGKKYHKQMKELRMSVRSSLYNKTSAASHTHQFGSEVYNEDDDTYAHTCTTCGYEETFEKM
ncbi:hypothetical protein ILUMI_24953 [Ignelater luminosus]|uniref:XPA C-terminal domain-containing protein n=1 Tax=Ignelater luminosus TaxID=2038154 RepID=A0A8K0C694_IGNLU|nr:hypothetical protein ILUMI_24953 [Ignelater luminosus]